MTSEREQSHAQANQDVSLDRDDAGVGRVSRSAQLQAPTSPVASGLLSRKAERDGNGVAAGAEEAVASASSSSGSALPDTLMRKFEGSLGTDLSSVRVHTGGESATAAQAVGAKAYTMGQDIHFGAGHYDPSSEGGQHLIAHEVAHTVQQRGGSPMRQNKLEVSAPYDAAEHEADRAADAMTGGQQFQIGGGASSVARQILHRDPDPNASDPQHVEAALAIDQWRQRANQCVLASSKWYADNFGKFLSLTSSNPHLSWTDGKVFGAFAGALGWGIGKVATALAVETMGAAIGGAAGGPPGAIAGFIIGKVAGMLTDEILSWIKGPSQTAAQNAAAAGQAVNASSQGFFAKALTGQADVEKIATLARQKLADAKSSDVAANIRNWAVAEMAAAKAPAPGDLSLFEKMYSDWVLEHTSSSRVPPHLEPGDGVDQGQWANGRRDAKPVDGKVAEQHLDLFGYQTRGFLSRIGLAPDAGDSMIAAAAGVKPAGAGALMKKFDAKPLVFRSADPNVLLGFLAKYIPYEAATDPKAPQDVRDGLVTVTVTPNLAIMAQVDSSDGAIVAKDFSVDVTMPDRQTYQSNDPMDAGRPPVDFGTGRPKAYHVGTISP